MQLEPIEKHLKKIQYKREELFIQSLSFINNYYNNSRNYYLINLFFSLVIILADLSLFFTFESDALVRVSLFFSVATFLFSLIIYLNFLEKGSEKIGDIFYDLDFKYREEGKIIKDFYNGKIEEKDIRNFYLSRDLNIEKKYFGNNKDIFLRWLDFIFLSLAMIFLLLNFI